MDTPRHQPDAWPQHDSWELLSHLYPWSGHSQCIDKFLHQASLSLNKSAVSGNLERIAKISLADRVLLENKRLDLLWGKFIYSFCFKTIHNFKYHVLHPKVTRSYFMSLEHLLLIASVLILDKKSCKSVIIVNAARKVKLNIIKGCYSDNIMSREIQLSTSCSLSFLLVLTTMVQYLQLYRKAVFICLHSTWSRMSPFNLETFPQRQYCHFLAAPSITGAMCCAPRTCFPSPEGRGCSWLDLLKMCLLEKIPKGCP